MAQMRMSSFEDVQNKLKQLILYQNVLGQNAEALFRLIILNIIAQEFPINIDNTGSDVPIWLQWLLLEMQKQNNYVEGFQAMVRISGKTKEHLCRTCKKYLKQSPTQIINEIRIREAARLLCDTDKDILTVCQDIGFESLSNFYSLFKKYFHMSPREMQKTKDLSALETYSLASAIFPNSLPVADPPSAILPVTID